MSLWSFTRLLICVVLRFDLTRDYSAPPSVLLVILVFILRRFYFFVCYIYRCYFRRRPETGRLNCVCDYIIDLKPGLLLWGRDLFLRKLIWVVGSSIALSSSESVGVARSIFFFCIFLLDYRM